MKYSGQGWCQTHYHRWWRHGDADFVGSTFKPVVTYRGLHARVTRKRGKAAGHLCVLCSGEASHWSYNGRDPLPSWERFGKRFIPYSLDIQNYVPLCKSCHVKVDRYHADVPG